MSSASPLLRKRGGVSFAPRTLVLLLGMVSLAAAQTSSDLMQEARQAVAAGQLDQARKLFTQLVAREPDNGEAHFFLAQIYAREGKDEPTIEHYLRALEALPQVARIWEFYGAWLLQEGYFGEAARVYRHLTETFPDSAEHCGKRAQAVYSDGDPSAALELLRECLKLSGAGAHELYLAALSARMLGDPVSAQDYIGRGLSLDAEHQELNFQMADLLLQKGDAAASLPYWEKLPPDHVAGLYGQGSAQLALGRLEQAQGLLEAVLARRPDHARACYQLGVVYRKQGEAEKAARMFERFRELEALDRERRKTQVKKEIVRKP